MGLFSVLVLCLLGYHCFGEVSERGAFFQPYQVGESHKGNMQHSLQRNMHRCSLKVACNYLVHDAKTNEFKFYSSEREIPADKSSLAIWRKTPVLHGEYGSILILRVFFS